MPEREQKENVEDLERCQQNRERMTFLKIRETDL